MILASGAIRAEINIGNIVIRPYDDNQLNPNSYDLRLGSKILVPKNYQRNVKVKTEYMEYIIPDEGFVLEEGVLYLSETLEYTETHGYLVPFIEGKSSVGRNGIAVHVTAGFGDIGFCGNWTLEIFTIGGSVRIYKGMRICQITWERVEGPISKVYEGKYQNAHGVIGSKQYEEFRNE